MAVLLLYVGAERADATVHVNDLQACRVGPDVDGITAAARRLATDRAIAALVGNGCSAARRKAHRAAAA